ncbi:MAG: hypothetical protein Tsb009_37590 [Planctomycetaceae bacterium]
MSEAIQVNIASDQEHEKVVAEIYHDGKFVMIVSRDHETAMVEIPGAGLDESCISRTVPLEELQEALRIAALRLND